MKRLFLIAALLAPVAGCAQLQTDWNVLTSASVSPTSVIVAANSFDALESAATTYLKLPACGGTSATPVCRTAGAVAQIVPAIRAGRTARNALEALLKSNGNAAIPVATYNTLKGAVSALQTIFAQYKIAS